MDHKFLIDHVMFIHSLIQDTYLKMLPAQTQLKNSFKCLWNYIWLPWLKEHAGLCGSTPVGHSIELLKCVPKEQQGHLEPWIKISVTRQTWKRSAKLLWERGLFPNWHSQTHIKILNSMKYHVRHGKVFKCYHKPSGFMQHTFQAVHCTPKWGLHRWHYSSYSYYW